MSSALTPRTILVPLALFASVGACGPAVPAHVAAPSAKPRRLEGAVLLAHPGGGARAVVAAGAPADVVRGRVRWHVDADGGATRAREVTRDASSTQTAFALPPWLGGGIAILGQDGLSVAPKAGGLRAILHGPLTNPSIGGKELWARTGKSNDWIRIDLASGSASFEPPPIAAPILVTSPTPWTGALAGHPVTAGPEFVSTKNAFAIVDLLGPVVTHDGGETWTPIERDMVRTAFGPNKAPLRLVRTRDGVSLAGDDRLVPMSPTGQLGLAVPFSSTRVVPADHAAVRIETVGPHGIALGDPDDPTILVADGGRLAVATLDPVRVLQVSRVPDLTRCELRKAPKDGPLAIAACTRHDDGPLATGAQLVVGTVNEAPLGPRISIEKVFPYATTFRFTATGAIVVAASCAGTGEGGVDLLAASKVCVREPTGNWREMSLLGMGSRRAMIPRSDGGVLIVRDEVSKGTEIVTLPRWATVTTVPHLLRLDPGAIPLAREILSFDEIAPGRFVLWRKAGKQLLSFTIEANDLGSRLVSQSKPIDLEDGAMIGVYADKAMIARLASSPKPVGTVRPLTGPDRMRVEALAITKDAGATWNKSVWPDDAPVYDSKALDRRIECGALGCRLFGWTRLGWQLNVASHDTVIDVAEAPSLPAMPDPPERSTTLRGNCAPYLPKAPFDIKRVPYQRPYWSSSISDVVLGAPEPKVGLGQSVVHGAYIGPMRGGAVAWGPTSGSWGDLARLELHFASDLDPLDAAFHATPIPVPFADRTATQRALNGMRAFGLGPGRALVVICDPYAPRCENVFRVTNGVAPERIDLSSIGDVDSISNARELGGTLFIVGLVKRETTNTLYPWLKEKAPFAAMISANGTAIAPLARPFASEDSNVVASVDAAHGKFALAITSAQPSWRGGTMYALPLDATAKPTSGFEILMSGDSELSKPIAPCSPTAIAWDRAEANPPRSIDLNVLGSGSVKMKGSATVRARLSSTSACLDRITLTAPDGSFQWEPSTHRATILKRELDGKGARYELTCTLSWE